MTCDRNLGQILKALQQEMVSWALLQDDWQVLSFEGTFGQCLCSHRGGQGPESPPPLPLAAQCSHHLDSPGVFLFRGWGWQVTPHCVWTLEQCELAGSFRLGSLRLVP